ncbi:MAG: VOC family protein, partial [Actinomycetota bacterium]
GRLIGFELYFEDLKAARRFYRDLLGLHVSEEDRDRYTKFDAGPAFLCLELKGSESYPSRDKAVVFLEVPDVEAAVAAIGPEHVVHFEPAASGRLWAVFHDPEGHNVLLLQVADRS